MDLAIPASFGVGPEVEELDQFLGARHERGQQRSTPAVGNSRGAGELRNQIIGWDGVTGIFRGLAVSILPTEICRTPFRDSARMSSELTEAGSGIIRLKA